MRLLMDGRSKMVVGYVAGLLAGMAYGVNPLFGKPLIDAGVSILTMLFFRYAISVLVIGGWAVVGMRSLKVSWREFGWLMLLGMLFAISSLSLFASYCYIPSGLATTLIYLYPVMVALLMVLQKVYPSRRTWISIIVTFVGVALMCGTGDSVDFHPIGILLAFFSALSYAGYFVIVNSVKSIQSIAPYTITLYSLSVGAALYLVCLFVLGVDWHVGLNDRSNWLCLLGLALIPTTVALLGLTISTRLIGATKAAVLGVTEPLTSIFIGVFLFYEPMTVSGMVGVGLCLVAILFLMTSRQP
ncbi:MAG: DMT family transporter [Paludibacteraceae bacterium]|nr:DMT family transporter [Paludibacteraceae bacterium]MBR4839469.1 DMT family transporter [Paludibacteraceae bacterium]